MLFIILVRPKLKGLSGRMVGDIGKGIGYVLNV
jgi:hypothetical protein